MRERAAEIRERFCLGGLFEWVAWSVRKKVQVYMLFGTGIVDLCDTFAPGSYNHPPLHTIHSGYISASDHTLYNTK